MSNLSERINRVKQHDAEKAELFEVDLLEILPGRLITYLPVGSR
jgi:hypothetical protein